MLELIARSDLIATVPKRLVRERAERLQLLEPPLPAEGFTIGLVWHRAHPPACGASVDERADACALRD